MEEQLKELGIDTIEKFMNKLNISNYSINEDGICVDGDVNLKIFEIKKLRRIPYAFGHVKGNFDISFCMILSLNNCPKSVGGDFNCSFNDLTNLLGSPKSVGGNYMCMSNRKDVVIGFTKGISEKVGGSVELPNCKINDIKHMPKYIGNNLNISNNNILTLTTNIEYIGGGVDASFNNIQNIDSMKKLIPESKISLLGNNYFEPQDNIEETRLW